MIYRYFVAFQFDRDGMTGFGRTEIRMKTPITCIEDIAVIKHDLEQDNKKFPASDHVLVGNYQLFEAKTDEADVLLNRMLYAVQTACSFVESHIGDATADERKLHKLTEYLDKKLTDYTFYQQRSRADN